MRRLVALTIALVSFMPATAAAEPFGPENAHWNCPAGIVLYAGGGSGVRQMMRQAADRWNAHARGPSAPDIVSIRDHDFNGLAWGMNAGQAPGMCIIDVDEYFADDNQAGLANVQTRACQAGRPCSRHIISAGILINGDYWNGGDDADFYVAFHELVHTFGFAHNFDQSDSVMSYAYECPCFASDDWRTLGDLYAPHHE